MRSLAKALVVGLVVLGLTLFSAGQQAPAKRPPAKPAPGQAPAPPKAPAPTKAPAPAETPDPAKDVPKYKAADEVKLKGTVVLVKNYECPISGTVGTHLVVKIDLEKYEAHIGPLKFLEEYGIQLKEGDTITLYGTKVKFGEGNTLLVRAIERENDQFFFRDKEGVPIWR